MKEDDAKTREELVGELATMRRRIAELEQLETERARAKKTLEESEKEYRGLFDNAMEGIFVTTAEGRLVDANMAFAGMLGYESPEEAIGRLTDVTNGLYADPEDRKKAVDAILEKGHVEGFECRARRKDGSVFWAAINARPAHLREGTPGFQGFAVDITARKQAEASINKYSEELKRRVRELDCLYAFSEIMRKDDAPQETVLQECTSLLSRAYQFPEITACRITWDGREYVTGNFRKTPWAQSRAVTVHGRQVGTVEVCYLEERPEEYEGPFLAEEGRLLESITQLLGRVAERRQAERALKESRRKFQALVETMYDWAWEVDSQGRYTYVSPRIKDLLHYEPHEVLGKTPYDLMSPEESKRVSKKVSELVEGRKPISALQNVKIDKDGHLVVLETNGRPFYDGEGNLRGYRGTDRDITERKYTEEALEKRIVALTRPLDDVEDIAYEDLFNLPELQRLQDLTAEAWGVAALITSPDGTPITRPSNFTYFCGEFVRKTEKGLDRCQVSDAAMGRHNPSGPIIQQCTSAGLWGAGASITVGGRHIANWLIGQVRNETQSEERIVEYAREIGADETAFREAFLEVPVMSREKFEKIAHTLFALANQLSAVAYQNIQQARFIVERKQAEDALRESERKLSEAHRVARLGHWTWDVATGRVEWSEEVFKIFHLDPGSFTPHIDSILALSPWPEEHERDRKLIRKAMESRERGSYEQRFLRPDKSIGYYLSSFQGKYDDDGNLISVVGTVQDITERRRAEETLANERRRLSDILEGTNVGTWEWNVQTGETTFNERWAEIVGYTAEELAPVSFRTWERLVHPDDLKISNDLLERHFRKELPYYECEARMRHKNGDWVWVLTRGRVATWTDDGKPLLMSGTHQDITGRKKAEEEREKLIADLREALSQVRALSGLLPICASCKKIRNDEGYWEQIEVYIREHSEADFSHCLCPECGKRLYPDFKEIFE